MSLLNIKIGKGAPEIVNAIIEVPKDSQNKYEIDKETGAIALDRVLYSPLHYPLDYGFIPETLCDDGDALDVMIIGSDPVPVGCVVRARVIGMMDMIDGGEQDNKLLAVQEDNPRFKTINDLDDIEKFMPHLLKEIKHFMEVYKELQNKKVEVGGWHNKAKALEEVIKSQKMYQDTRK